MYNSDLHYLIVFSKWEYTRTDTNPTFAESWTKGLSNFFPMNPVAQQTDLAAYEHVTRSYKTIRQQQFIIQPRTDEFTLYKVELVTHKELNPLSLLPVLPEASKDVPVTYSGTDMKAFVDTLWDKLFSEDSILKDIPTPARGNTVYVTKATPLLERLATIEAKLGVC